MRTKRQLVEWRNLAANEQSIETDGLFFFPKSLDDQKIQRRTVVAETVIFSELSLVTNR